MRNDFDIASRKMTGRTRKGLEQSQPGLLFTKGIKEERDGTGTFVLMGMTVSTLSLSGYPSSQTVHHIRCLIDDLHVRPVVKDACYRDCN
jgi:hypothetical protein